MKNKLYLLFFVLFGLLLLSSCIIYVPYPEGSPPPQEEPYYEEDYRDTPSRYDTSYFYDKLSPHGMWAYHSPHGYVWVPNRVAINIYPVFLWFFIRTIDNRFINSLGR